MYPSFPFAGQVFFIHIPPFLWSSRTGWNSSETLNQSNEPYWLICQLESNTYESIQTNLDNFLPTHKHFNCLNYRKSDWLSFGDLPNWLIYSDWVGSIFWIDGNDWIVLDWFGGNLTECSNRIGSVSSISSNLQI